MHAAIWEGRKEIAKALIESGAEVNATMLGPLGWTPIGEAARFGLVDTINELLDHGARIDSRTRSGAMPLHLAIEFKQYRAAETLLRNGADVNAITADGSTPLQLFANNSRDERGAAWDDSQDAVLLEMLLAKGANVNAKADGGSTALHYAVLRNNLRTARILTENGADPDVMELPDRQYYGSTFHHEGSEMTLQQRISDTLQSSWWTQGVQRIPNLAKGL